VVALVALANVGCRASEPRFGSLVADARRLTVANEIRMVALSNGMTVAMAPDRRTNLVSVDVRYRVGSADDPVGRAGMAHLVEHLAFEIPSGSQGATLFNQLTALTLGYNAYTNKDVTHYMATALSDRIDALIELEAQRLEAQCAQIDDHVFARERDVVLEEEAQRRSPLQGVLAAVDAKVWGAGHPYGRPIGSREIATATKAEACAFFDAHYAPDRAVMVVTGNFEPELLQQRIGQRFGPIAKHATATPVEIAAPRLDGTHSEHVADIDHPMALIYLPAPAWGGPEEAVYDMLLLALNVELDELDTTSDWVVSASASYAGSEGRRRAIVLAVEVDDPQQLDRAVDAALARGRDLFSDRDHDGHNDDDDDADDRDAKEYLTWIRGQLQTSTIGRFDRIDGRGDWLADFLTYTDHYEFALANLRALDEVTGEALVHTAKTLFDRERGHVALVRSSGQPTIDASELVASSEQTLDLEPWRTEVDPAEASRALVMPRDAAALTVDDFRLTNGIRVLLRPDLGSPVVDARLVYPVGIVDERPGTRGTARLAARLLSQDYDRDFTARSLALIRWALGLGTQSIIGLQARSTLFVARGPSVFADWHVWRLSWWIDQGVYTRHDADVAHRDAAEAAADDDQSPAELAFRQRLYGEGHPFASPRATPAEIAKIGVPALNAWRRAHFATDGATLIVTGGFKRDVMRQVVIELFGAWAKTTSSATTSAVPPPSPAPGPSWIRETKPQATQVGLFVSFASASDPGRDRAARLVLVEMIDDRLRLIREGLGASYGVSVGYAVADGGVELAIATALDPQRAPAAATGVMAALAALRTDVTSSPSDFARARRRVFGRLLASRTDAVSVADDLSWMVDNQLSLAQLTNLAADVGMLTPAMVAKVAASDLDPTRGVTMVQGRSAPLDATMTALGATAVATFDR